METVNHKISQSTYRTLFWLLITAITLFRLFFADKFGLGVDESHYLLYSRHLAWGYFDHPPMVAFLAALTTLFGRQRFLGPTGADHMRIHQPDYSAIPGAGTLSG